MWGGCPSASPAQRLLGNGAFCYGLGLYFASRRLSVEILIISDYLTYVLPLSWIEAFLLSLRLMRKRGPLQALFPLGAGAPEHGGGLASALAGPC